MTKSQILLQVVGWGIIFWIHLRTLQKSELARQKDALLGKLDDIFEYLDKELEKQDCSFLDLEQALASKLTLLEFRLAQLNSLARTSIVSPSIIARLRNIDLSENTPRSIIRSEANELHTRATEEIETGYNRTFNQRSLWIYLVERRAELGGAALALAVLIGAYIVINAYLSWI